MLRAAAAELGAPLVNIATVLDEPKGVECAVQTIYRAAAASLDKYRVALIDDLGGYNVPWRNPDQKMADDLVELSQKQGTVLNNFYTFKFVSMFRPNPSKLSSRATADLHQPPFRATAARSAVGYSVAGRVQTAGN